jgi:adenosylcobyric acid synthase
MIQGTSSAAGKSLLSTALCRIFRRDGLRVAPFKAQNLSLNSAVTRDGREIGRSQALQAQACRLEPDADMNPVLLKPESNMRTQVVLHGTAWKSVGPGEWDECRPLLWDAVVESLERLRSRFDLLVIEGAGSPVEINLTQHEIANMRVARLCSAPVLLAASIELGGVFASIVGTLALLGPEERALVKGFVINKFRGDPGLLASGLRMLEERTSGTPTLGVIPYMEDLRLPQEDAALISSSGLSPDPGGVDVAVIHLPHVSNFDDCDPLAMEPGVHVRFVSSVEDLGAPDALIIPGSKATLADLAWLVSRGFGHAIRAYADGGGVVVGICGGYQMMGLAVHDRAGSEGVAGSHRGMSLLPVETNMEEEKTVRQVAATVSGGSGFLGLCAGVEVSGYEIHRGRTAPAAGWAPVFTRADGSPDGAAARGGRIWGTYLHGVFGAPDFRRAWLSSIGWRAREPGSSSDAVVEREIDRVADVVSASLDMDRVRRIAGV